MRLPLLSVPFRLVAVVTLVAAGVAFAPGKAFAACGDYVHISGQAEPESRDTPVSPRPCHGPGCSKRPQSPDLPPGAPVVTSPELKEVAMRAGRESDADTRSEWVIASPSADRVVRLPSAIFHPPRAL